MWVHLTSIIAVNLFSEQTMLFPARRTQMWFPDYRTFTRPICDQNRKINYRGLPVFFNLHLNLNVYSAGQFQLHEGVNGFGTC